IMGRVADAEGMGRLNVPGVRRRCGGIGTLMGAADGAEALAVLRSGELPEWRLVVILDLCMPRVSGLDVLRQIRADPGLQSIPVVIMTHSSAGSQVAEAFRLHAAGYILKPASLRQLIACLESFVTYWTHVEFPPRAQA